MKSPEKSSTSEFQDTLSGIISQSSSTQENEDNSYLTSIIFNIGDPIFVKNEQSQLLIVNDAFCELFNLTREDIIGKTLAENVLPEERESFLEIDKQVLFTGTESINEESLTLCKGEFKRISTRKKRFIDPNGKKYLVGVIHDITERYETENELLISKLRAEQNEERFRILMLNMDAGVIIHAPDTSIIQNNKRASEILGLSDDELRGKKVIDSTWKFVKEDKSPLPLDEFPVNLIARTKASIKNKLLGVFHPGEKEVIWLSVNGFPVLNNVGEIVEIVTVFVDITEQKLFEEAQFKHQRIKAIGEMSASIAHDFNNSLQEMLGELEVLKLENEFSESALGHFDSIKSIISDAADRVSSLQKFGDSENDSENSQLIDLNNLIVESLAQSRSFWKDSMEKDGVAINVSTNFNEIPKINCNKGELKSAIHNLIKNSIEAMPQGGELTINTTSSNDQVVVTFTDTGIGMDENAKLKIFEPFFTTKGFSLGRGLGMSGVYGIINKNKGNIVVKSSEVNKGTTLEISFPISHQEEIQVLNEDTFKENKTLRVLWVDDDFIILKSSGMMVESIGHSCKTTNNGIKALEYLENNPCDIVFTDIGMPKMNGWELIDAIRENHGNKIKIAVVSGWSIEKKVKQKHGIDFVLQKPFGKEDLQSVLQQL